MPELPEVETTRLGIAPFVIDRRVIKVEVRQPKLRWPTPLDLEARLSAQRIESLYRRGKYLLFGCKAGHLMVHLGMSGSLRLVSATTLPGKHDHLDIHLDSGQLLRYTDPRRFGAVLWLEGDPAEHKLLCQLGPEPLSSEFSGEGLYCLSRKRTTAVKSFIMDSKIVVGVGNIYANEALFSAGIRPQRQAGRISRRRYEILANAIKTVLQQAIQQGGTTLRDFVGGDGKPGYFSQSLQVYGRAEQACPQCRGKLQEIRIAQRSSVYCLTCQT